MTENLLTNEIPEKFKDPETGGLKADALLRSYKELEKNSRKVAVLPNRRTNIASIARTGCSSRIPK
jgi:hypothetical protein